MSSSPTNPLPTNPTDTLSELFSRDPEQLSDSDIDTIVAELRAQRHRWNQEELEKASKPKRQPKGKSAATKEEAQKLLDSLDIGELDFGP